MADAPAAVSGRVLLLAHDAADVALVSALVQDAVVRPADIVYDARARRLLLLVSRFRWEAGDLSRVRCAVRFEHVGRLQRRGWPAADASLDLLAITADGDALTVAFAGGATLRAAVECVDLIVEDVGEPWPAACAPAHPDDR